MPRASSTKKKQAYQPPNIQSLTPIERIDFPFGRAYAPLLGYLRDNFKTQEWTKENRQHIPSVTTIQNILSKGIGFEKWLGSYGSYEEAMEYANTAATEGTQIHLCLEQLTMGVDMDFTQPFFDVDKQETREWTTPMIKFMESGNQFFLDHMIQIEGNEVPLFDSRKDYTGTADMIARIKVEEGLSPSQAKCTDLKEGMSGRIMLDIKTLRNSSTLSNKFENHKYQVTAYKNLWEGLFPDHPIDFMGVLYVMNSWRGAPKYKLKLVEEDLTQEWDAMVKLWYGKNGAIKPVYAKPRPRGINSCFKQTKDVMITDKKMKSETIVTETENEKEKEL
jgi:hypothetical protein